MGERRLSAFMAKIPIQSVPKQTMRLVRKIFQITKKRHYVPCDGYPVGLEKLPGTKVLFIYSFIYSFIRAIAGTNRQQETEQSRQL